MKKIIALLLSLTLVMGMMTACSTTEDVATGEDSTVSTDSTETEETDETTGESLKVVTTIFPVYDWTKTIIGDSSNIELSMLIDTGVDLHSFEPTTDDMIEIMECDVFIYIGGESDYWVDDILANSTNEDMEVICLFDVLGSSVLDEEVVEGMEDSHDHDHDEETEEETEEDHDHDEETEEESEEDHDHDEEEEETEADEHIWLSLNNAKVSCSAIAEVISALDSANSETYSANLVSYHESLTALDAQYQEVVENANFSTVIFTDRFPFRYLVEDYDIEYYAAFVGCSTETDASFETITFLAEKIDELGLETVFIIDGSDGELAEAVISITDTADQEIVTVDSMQTTDAAAVADGASYLDIMTENLEAFRTALG